MNDNFLKVLLVDDEYWVRRLIKRCIDWNSIGLEVVGEASSGEDAIELVDKIRPDIIFTDICMSSIDGIEFADGVIQKYPGTKVVVITGYDDFKYAQRSIRSGIREYLLKPIDDEEVMKTALEMKKEILEERRTTSEYTELKKQFIENRDFFIERLLNSLIQPDINIDEVKIHMDYLDFQFKYNNFQVAVLDILSKYKESNLKEEIEIDYKIKTLEELKKAFHGNEKINIFFDINYRITLVINIEQESERDFFNIVKLTLQDALKCSISIGCSSIINGIENIGQSYNEALEQLNSPRMNMHNKLIDDISEYVKLNIQDSDLSLSKVSQVFFVNASYLSRIFKKEVGINLMEYITKLRIDKAKMLIKNSELKAYEIAEKVGIPDPSYFSTCFKRYTGLS
ncbi:MAG: response regulator, partial [Bacillota bacterium]|nr:response regulator [Bacillota bacterium]